jgi:light-harvesting protein B-800-850 alpha chain
MIYGKLWCVVKPSTGIPLFLSAVAISSFAVHLALLSTAPWLKAFYAGKEAPAKTSAAPATEVLASATLTVKP